DRVGVCGAEAGVVLRAAGEALRTVAHDKARLPAGETSHACVEVSTLPSSAWLRTNEHFDVGLIDHGLRRPSGSSQIDTRDSLMCNKQRVRLIFYLTFFANLLALRLRLCRNRGG